MKIEFTIGHSELSDKIFVSMMEGLREDLLLNIEMAIMEEDILDCQEVLKATDVILAYYGVQDGRP
jgi:hypothetical protein